MSSCTLDTGNFTNGRMAQINNYNIQYYRFYSATFYRYSIILIFLIILVILRNAYIISEQLFGMLITPVLAYWLISFIYTYYSFKSRGPLNFDTIIWRFDKKSAPSLQTNGDSTSSSSSSSTGNVCVGASCCSFPQYVYSERENKCVLASNEEDV